MNQSLRDSIVMSPLFIVGAERSGTTWLQRLLLSDDRFAGGQESHFFQFAPRLSLLQELRDAERSTGPACYMSEAECIQLTRETWRSMFSRVVDDTPTCEILVEKTPRHAFHVADIAATFERPKIVHIVRDGRAVALSLLRAYKDGWGKRWAPSRFDRCCKLWQRSVKAAEEADALDQCQYLLVHYEAIKASPKQELSRVVQFALNDSGASWTPTESSQGFGLEQKEPDGFARLVDKSAWRKEVTIFQRLAARYIIGSTLRQYGYPLW